jgi:dienelactone hydrolase
MAPVTDPRSFQLPGTGAVPLDGLLRLPAGSGASPVVVLCHGFKGFMEWGFFPPLADLLSDRGFVVVSFNFSGSGMEPGEDRATRLEAFRRNTYSQELDDLATVLEAVGTELAPRRADPSQLGIFGHSRGGGTALLTAAQPRWRERVRALVTWSAVSTFDRLSEEERRQWREAGEITITNSRTGQELPLGVEALDDLERNRQALDLKAAAGRRTAPWLVVHGEEDPTVPVAEGQALAAAAAAPVELSTVPGADHTFGARHPFAGPTPQLVTAMNATQRWFRRHLRGV